jgi:hypothetical protein
MASHFINVVDFQRVFCECFASLSFWSKLAYDGPIDVNGQLGKPCPLMYTPFLPVRQPLHCKEQYRKVETNISRKGIARPNFYIPVSVSDLYIPRIVLPILLQENIWTRNM